MSPTRRAFAYFLGPAVVRGEFLQEPKSLICAVRVDPKVLAHLLLAFGRVRTRWSIRPRARFEKNSELRDDMTIANKLQIAEKWRRYEALKAAGTGNASTKMPPLTLRGGLPPDPRSIVMSEAIPDGWYANYRLTAGERLRIENIEGQFCGRAAGLDRRRDVRAAQPRRYRHSCGRHDTSAGACSCESNTVRFAHHTKFEYACRKTLWLKSPMNVPIAPNGDPVIDDGISAPGSYVEMVAEMDVLCVISNCPQINNPCNGFNPTPVGVGIYEPSAS